MQTLQYSPDGLTIAVSGTNSVYFINGNPSTVTELSVDTSDGIPSIAYSPNGTDLGILKNFGNTSIYNFVSGTFTNLNTGLRAADNIDYSLNGNEFAIVVQGTMKIYDTINNAQLLSQNYGNSFEGLATATISNVSGISL